MTRFEHLLCILSEECAEVAQRVSKDLRFGLDEIQPDQPLTNAERITREYADLVSVLLMLKRECRSIGEVSPAMLEAKRAKVEKFLKYSEACGTCCANWLECTLKAARITRSPRRKRGRSEDD